MLACMNENTEKKRLAVSGDTGSFSEEAGLAYARREGIECDLVYAIDMEGVLARMESGEVDLGIFPVVNSRGGLVQTAFEAMGRHHFEMIGELWLEVQQCLLCLPGVTKEKITEVTTHPQALSQCERYLKRELPTVPLIEWDDTAKAARDLVMGKLPATSAVIAPARAALVYGLEVIERSIQDMHPNLTTFIIVKKFQS